MTSTCGCAPPAGQARSPRTSHPLPHYQDREAWTWEHMALTRARVISASPEFRARIERIIRDVLTRPRDRRHHRQRRSRDAPRHRAGEGRGRRLGPEICRRRHWSTSISSRSICSSSTPPTSRIFSTSARCSVLDNAAAARACCRNRPPKCLRPAARLYHDLTQILRLCVTEQIQARNRRAKICCGCWRGPAMLRIFPRSKRGSRKPRPRCARVFHEIVEGGG